MEEKCFLKMAKDLVIQIKLGRSFHPEKTVNVKVGKSDFVLVWDVPLTCRTHVSRGHISLK